METEIPGEVPLRGLWWGPPDQVGESVDQPYGNVIVLLHGVGDGADVWRPTMAAWLSRRPHLRVLALDLPGHAGTARLPTSPYRVRDIVRVVSTALHGLGVSQPVIIGHSLGARVAMELTGGLGPDPLGLILVDMQPDEESRTDQAVVDHIDMLIAGAPSLPALHKAISARMPLSDPDVLSEVLSALSAREGDRVRIDHDPAIRHLVRDRYPGGLWRLAGRYGGPVGIVRGAYSSVLSKADADRFYASLRHPRGIETIAMAGHAIPLEQPAALADALDRLLIGS